MFRGQGLGQIAAFHLPDDQGGGQGNGHGYQHQAEQKLSAELETPG